MEITLICVLLFITVIGAFISPGISKSSSSHIVSLRERGCRQRSNLTRGKVQASILCAVTNPSEDAEIVDIVSVPSKAAQEEAAAELLKESKLKSSYIVLGILLMTFACNQWSRQALYYLCDFSSNADPFKHINAAVNFNKEQYASLASFGFTVVFASVSLFAGAASDKFDRNVVMALSCGVWSIATGLQGFATGDVM